MALAALLGAVVVAGLIWLVLPASQQEASTPLVSATASPASPSSAAIDLTPAPKGRLDASKELGRAKARALGWSEDAVLVSIFAGPIVQRHVDTRSGGHARFVFGRPSTRRAGPGSMIDGEQLVYRAGDGAPSVKQESHPGRIGVTDPGCPLDAALSNARAAGLTASPTFARYAYDAARQRAVWTFMAAADGEPEKALDGESCAVLRH